MASGHSAITQDYFTLKKERMTRATHPSPCCKIRYAVADSDEMACLSSFPR
jgi:hypothetical protein